MFYSRNSNESKQNGVQLNVVVIIMIIIILVFTQHNLENVSELSKNRAVSILAGFKTSASPCEILIKV
jgi:hypothetical protein